MFLSPHSTIAKRQISVSVTLGPSIVDSTPNTVPRSRETGGSGSASSYIRSSLDEQPIKLSLTLARSVGVPTSHSATPLNRELYLDPVTLRPVSSLQPLRHSDAIDISNLQGQALVPAHKLDSLAGSPVHRPVLGPFSTTPGSPPSISLSNPAARGRVASDGTTDVSLSITSDHSTGVHPSSELASSLTNTSWMWPIAEAVSSRRPVLVPNIPTEVAEDLSRRAWGDVPLHAVVVPIYAYEGERSDISLPQAVLVLGLNPRRPYDKDYEDWVDLLRTSLGVSLAAVLSWEAETQRAECVWLEPIFSSV